MVGISKGNPDGWGRDLESGVSFLSSLNHATLLEARRCIRRVFHRMGHTDLSWLDDRECDKIIEAMGPDAMEEARYLEADQQRLEGLAKRIRVRRSAVTVSMLDPTPPTPKLDLATSVSAALKER